MLDELYERFNRREYISPDPLEFLYHYDSLADREAVGLIASSFAYGRVAGILSSVRKVLEPLGSSPAAALAECDRDGLARHLSGFVHRFTGGEETVSFLTGIGVLLCRYGMLKNLFAEGMRQGDGDMASATESFVDKLLSAARLPDSHLLPRPSRGSACKRLALYLRWMVRQDDVDPGGWGDVVPQEKLIVPLDTHMFRIARGLGFISRASADGRAAAQATAGFRALCPHDPVRYDFALTRFGIRTGESVDDLLAKFSKTQDYFTAQKHKNPA